MWRIKDLFNKKNNGTNGSRPYTEEEREFALELYYAMGLKHAYWTDQFGCNRFTDEALGGWFVDYNEDLILKYARNV